MSYLRRTATVSGEQPSSPETTARRYNSLAVLGVRHLVEAGRTPCERLFWTVFLVASLAWCFYLIADVYKQWESSQFIESYAKTLTSISQIPFPAVTICPQTKNRQRVFNFTDMYLRTLNENVSEIEADELERFLEISLICDANEVTEENLNFSQATLQTLTEVAPPISEIMFICKWQGRMIVNCSELFSPILTNEGLCYTFNLLRNNDLFLSHDTQKEEYEDSKPVWTLETGYSVDDLPLDTLPFRAQRMARLNIVLRTHQDDFDILCRGQWQGFKVLLNHPAEVPHGEHTSFVVPVNRVVSAAVKPSLINISEELWGLDLARRQCYLPAERQLKHYKLYTQRKCEMECFANRSLAVCGCTAFYLPRSPDTAICGGAYRRCLQNVADDLESHKTNNDDSHDSRMTSSPACSCLPTCTSLEYDARTHAADWEYHDVYKAYQEDNETEERTALSHVSIYFERPHFFSKRRVMMDSRSGFLARCGGLLALFSGLVSLMEVLFYLNARLWGRSRDSLPRAEPATLTELALLSAAPAPEVLKCDRD